MLVKAECTWGDGPDVLVSGDFGRDGYFDTFDLSSKEARRLAAELIVAAERAEELERAYVEHAEIRNML